MAAELKNYPLKATTDCRTAIVETLTAYLEGIIFTVPKSTSPFKFRAVYSRWSDFNNRANSAGGLLPAAAVLPDRHIYEGAGFTPKALEETWSGGDPTELDQYGSQMYPMGDGSGDGFLLVETAELNVPLVLIYRGQTEAIRNSISKRLEEVLVEDGTLVPDPSSLPAGVEQLPPDAFQPVRYGLRLEMPSYYKRKARYTMVAKQTLDTAESAHANRWIGQVELQAQAQVCVLRRGRALDSRIELVVNGEPESR